MCATLPESLEGRVLVRVRFAAILVVVLAAVLGGASPAGAVVGGQLDGEDHPYSAVVLVPGEFLCSGTLIAPTVVLTAGHCTYEFSELGVGEVLVSFDPSPEVTSEWQPVDRSDWYTSSTWYTHPDFVFEDAPGTTDVGVLILDRPADVTPAQLPSVGLLDRVLPANGATKQEFEIVGYGISGFVKRQPVFDFVRRQSSERVWTGAPFDPVTDQFLFLNLIPSPQHGGTCPGDSGSGVFLGATDTLVAVHVGGFSVGRSGLCGRGLPGREVRLDTPNVLDWLRQFV